MANQRTQGRDVRCPFTPPRRKSLVTDSDTGTRWVRKTWARTNTQGKALTATVALLNEEIFWVIADMDASV